MPYVLSALLLAVPGVHGASMGASGKPCAVPGGGADLAAGVQSMPLRIPHAGGWSPPPANLPWRPPGAAYGGAPYGYSYSYSYSYPPVGAAIARPVPPAAQRRGGTASPSSMFGSKVGPMAGPGGGAGSGMVPWPAMPQGGVQSPQAGRPLAASRPGGQPAAVGPSRPASAAQAAAQPPLRGRPVTPYAGPTDDPWAAEDASRHARP